MNIKLSDKFRTKGFKRGEKSQNDPKPLSKNEFEILQKHTFESDLLNLTKTRFLLQCSTGMRYSDIFNIKPYMIVDECICYEPQKTLHKRDNKVQVPLNNISRTILQGVEFDSSKLKVSNQKYNDSLEKMWNKLNESYPNEKYPNTHFDNYTTHNGRDTFISYSIESGVDIPTLLKWVGQESYEVMKRYFKNTTEHIKEKMNNVQVFN